MICQATYSSLDAIPEALRDEFTQVNGKWQLKEEAIPGVGSLFNSALAANEQKAVGQVKTRNERIRALEEENNTLKDRASVLDQPGHKVLSPEDSRSFEAYTTLGAPEEIKAKLTELPKLSQKVLQFETKENLGQIVKVGSGINLDVLADWAATSEAEGLSFFVKSVEQIDTKGNKTNVEVPYARIEKLADGKTTVSEKELLPFAKETLPEWKYAALTTASNGSEGDNKILQKTIINNGGVKIPNLGSARKAPSGEPDKKKPVDTFNEQRANRPSPFAKPIAPATGMGIVK